MENNEKVMAFRDAAIQVIERNKIYSDDEVSHEQLIYNAGYNAGVLDLMAQIETEFVKKSKEFEAEMEEKLGHIKELQNILGDLKKSGPYDGTDPDVEDYLGGND